MANNTDATKTQSPPVTAARQEAQQRVFYGGRQFPTCNYSTATVFRDLLSYSEVLSLQFRNNGIHSSKANNLEKMPVHLQTGIRMVLCPAQLNGWKSAAAVQHHFGNIGEVLKGFHHSFLPTSFPFRPERTVRRPGISSRGRCQDKEMGLGVGAGMARQPYLHAPSIHTNP